jgi:hypothetical protein
MTIVNLIGNTLTKAGLSIQSEVDDTHYETGQKVDDDVMESLAITRCDFHGEWNYRIAPKTSDS